MPSRYYSTTAVATTLLADITNVATSCSVGSIAGMPTSFPFSLTLEPNTANVEVVDVTAVTGTGPYSLTIARAKDGTTAVAHHLGDAVKHLITARDLLDLAQQMQVDSASGLVVPAFQTAFRNAVINGQGAVSQRGTSGSGCTSSAISARSGPDCWTVYRGSTVTGSTWTQLTTADTLPAGFTNGIRLQRTAADASVQPLFLVQSIESKDSVRFRSRPTALTFWARCGALYSSASSLLNVIVESGTGTDENVVAAALTGQVVEASSTPTLTTSWQKFYLPAAALASNLNELVVGFYYTPVGTAGATDYIDITGVQFEDGIYPSPFEFRPYQVELALCQRRYRRLISDGTNMRLLCSGTTTSVTVALPYPVPMRIAPVIAHNITDASFSNTTTGNTWGLVPGGTGPWTTKTATLTAGVIPAAQGAIMEISGMTLSAAPNNMGIFGDRIIEFIADI
jgi:hypothetical protein